LSAAGARVPDAPDPEASFAVADPGKEWRRGHRIPVIPSFDGYRAWAILGVVLFHVFQVSGTFTAAGDSALGVLLLGLLPRTLDLLFIVSGFVIYLPTVVKDGDFGRVGSFAIRRAARLFPAYYVALLIAIALLAFLPHSGGVPGAGTIAAHMAVMQTPSLLFVDGFELGFGVVTPVWTLSVEVGYYLVLPFIAAAYFRHPIAGLATAGAITVGWALLGQNSDWAAGLLGAELSAASEQRIDAFYASQFPAWILAIASGMTGAWAYVRMRDRIPAERLGGVAVTGTALAVLAFGAIVVFGGIESVNDPGVFQGLFGRQSLLITVGSPLVLMVLLVCFALMPERLQRSCSASPIRWLGDVSYGIFLIHFAVIWLLFNQTSLATDGGGGTTLAWCAIVYPVSIAYAYLSARFLERPIRRWAHRYGRRGEEAPSRARPWEPAGRT
jgi:peptidoglycan/LPS O-acetylase OafA/YrhL